MAPTPTTSTDSKAIALPQTLQEAIVYFSDEQVAHDFLVSVRFPSGVCCVRCGDMEVGFLAKRRLFYCKGCKKQFSIKAGTILEDSQLPLSTWMPAFWLLTSAKNGISSCELARALGLTQKTAWFVLHRIRHVLKTGDFKKMEGIVEADETYIGGKEKNKHFDKKQRAGRGGVGKTIVAGVLERGETYIDKHGESKKKPSRVKANIIADTTKTTLHDFVKTNVTPGTDLMTDAAKGYKGLETEYNHQFIDHAVTYVQGIVYTNGLENFWAQVDRTLGGTYISVEPGHLMAYIDEQAFRFNERGTNDAGRFLTAVGAVKGKRLTYHKLIGSPNGINSPDPKRGGPRAD